MKKKSTLKTIGNIFKSKSTILVEDCIAAIDVEIAKEFRDKAKEIIKLIRVKKLKPNS